MLTNVHMTCPPGGGGSGTITGGINLGSGAETFNNVLGDNLRFKSLIEGTGITIAQSSSEIEMTNDIIATSSISVCTV